MTLVYRTRCLFFVILAAVAMIASSARASFHVMQIEQIIGGVNGDTTKQAIQLRMRTSFQNQLQFSQIRAWDENGANPVVLATFSTPVTNFNTGDRILVCTAAFAASTTPAAVADRIMMNPIPASYLAAGRITFEDTFGTIYWMVCYGGANYHGPTTGSFTNDFDGNFGPPFAGPLPTTGVQALIFQGTADAPSTSNATDYALTMGAAVFTNNAHSNFTVGGPPPPPTGACCIGTNCSIMTQTACTGAGGAYLGDNIPCTSSLCDRPACPCDFNQSGSLNSQDFFDFISCFFTVNCPSADFNHNGSVNSQDFFDFLNCFFTVPPGC